MCRVRRIGPEVLLGRRRDGPDLLDMLSSERFQLEGGVGLPLIGTIRNPAKSKWLATREVVGDDDFGFGRLTVLIENALHDKACIVLLSASWSRSDGLNRGPLQI